MKILCIEPIIRSEKICSFTVFDSNYKFLYHCFTDINKISKYLNQDNVCICYNIFKVLDFFKEKIPFLYDIKILYELQSIKNSNLIDLGREVFNYSNKCLDLIATNRELTKTNKELDSVLNNIMNG